jgi:hypothetical protein
MGGASYAVMLPAEFFSTFRREGETLPICWLLSTGLRAKPRPPRAIREADGVLPPSFRHFQEVIMNEDAFNISVRKFLKKVGVTSQREIEQAVRAALGDGRLKGNETLPARVMLTVDGIGLAIEIKGAIGLE